MEATTATKSKPTESLDAEVLPAPKRMPSIDFDEALAMFFVVLYHSRYYGVNFLENGLSVFPLYALNGLLSTCVPMFFLVNGFLLFRKDLDLRKHIAKTVRLAVVTVIWSFIIPAILCPITGTEVTLRELFDLGWYRKAGWNNQLWFMGALVCLYIFFPLLKVAYDKCRPAFVFFTITCAIMTFGTVLLNESASAILCGFFGRESLFDFDYFKSFNPFGGRYDFSFVYFCVGGLLWEKKDILASWNPQTRIATASVTLLVSTLLLAGWGWLASTVNGKIFDSVFHGYDTVFVFANTIALFILGLSHKGKSELPHHLILAISQNTLGILYIHNIVRVVLDMLVSPSAALLELLSSFAGSALYACVIVLVSLGIVLLIKKIPLLRKLV